MRLAAVLFWWSHRHILKAKGYSLARFCEMTAAFWKDLLQNADKQFDTNEASLPGVGEALARRQIRIRW